MVAQCGQWDMRGRTVLVSGGTGGIGFETARALARHGARVIITGRNAGHGEHAATVIRSERGGASVTFIQADHSTVGGNQRVADHVRNAFPRLNVLINNVGGLYETGGRRPTDTRPRWP
jgi:retinol dehydrogenase-14